MLKTILGFLFIISVIVVVHEFGHFYMAKKAGVLVHEFSVGMGPKLFQVSRGETLYTLRVLPIGGYVRLAGEEDEEAFKPGMTVYLNLNADGLVNRIYRQEEEGTSEFLPFQIQEIDLQKKLVIKGFKGQDTVASQLSVSRLAKVVEGDGSEWQIAPLDRQFASAKLWQRMLINAAGPINNFLLAIFVFICVAFLNGGVASGQNQLGTVVDGSVAQAAGLESGDRIIAVDGKSTDDWKSLVTVISQSPNQEIQLEVQRGDTIFSKSLIPEAYEENGQTVGKIGITSSQDSSLSAKILYGFKATFSLSVMMILAIGNLFRSFSINDLGGPVALFQTTSQVVQGGFTFLLTFMAFISINIGIANLFPIPALDGGKLFLNVIELVRGKPIPKELEERVTVAGMILMLILMVAVTWNDIMRLF